ncbi:DUF1800 domain-containing protein [Hydrogenimonas cancrithermarum]|uniref:DUF1800 domain-containing protein n=1 Tax=Hydrogenimonas cancrithermarum TaxID=2993563 RepID=A0ABN6WUS7_9BACT|nr:DUF1800 domain-containing protein [Hydrogenimonas cancrithermarum]BDY12062.1 hypothetical protein HCR_03740 [Hydrogenimonas cancrithermarum]
MRFDEARHLLSRTSFGIRPEDLTTMQTFSYEEGVESLLDKHYDATAVEAPQWIGEPLLKRRIKDLSPTERAALRQKQRKKGIELKIWWYERMVTAEDQLREWMTRFWHGHFTSELKKVKWPILMYRQNVLFRKHALGNFATLLHAVAKDGAMIIYLDTIRNKKGHPNENFGRELLELFTLGEGHYSESDIKNAARAFSGWSLKRSSGAFRFVGKNHDDGIKYFLGQTGRFGGEEIIDIILKQYQTARFVSGKLFKALVGKEPDPLTEKEIAGIFYDSGYAIKPLLRAILLSDAFRNPKNRGMMIKSPAELIAGTMRAFNLSPKTPKRVARLGKMLGEDLFDPPGVKGYFEGEAWITTASLLMRINLMHNAARRIRDKLPAGYENGNRLKGLLLPTNPAKPFPSGSAESILAACLTDPAYQLK